MCCNCNTDLNPDAFQRLRVSTPYAIFESKHDVDQTLFATSVSGVSGIVHAGSSVSQLISVVGGSNRVIRKTKRYFKYQPSIMNDLECQN